jgi:hypothetical protein
MKRVQLKTLTEFRRLAYEDKWDKIHDDHFDWWMFPVDNCKTYPQFTVFRDDITELKADQEYHSNYLEGVRLVAMAWGWDVDRQQRVYPLRKGMHWTNWDIRLAKIIRSLWLFKEPHYLQSMQMFARSLKPNGGFYHGTKCLDDIFYMIVPSSGTTYSSSAAATNLASFPSPMHISRTAQRKVQRGTMHDPPTNVSPPIQQYANNSEYCDRMYDRTASSITRPIHPYCSAYRTAPAQTMSVTRCPPPQYRHTATVPDEYTRSANRASRRFSTHYFDGAQHPRHHQNADLYHEQYWC